jgi:prophage tail gpP-like protein
VTTDRVTLEIAGRSFVHCTRIGITRSLEEISASFELDFYDQVRASGVAVVTAGAQALREAVRQGQACTIRIDDEAVLIGHIDELRLSWTGDEMRFSAAGRDRTGDLVDCAAAPDGPAEYRGLTLTEIARRICTPYGISVRADTDVGAPIPVFSLDAAETALSALEKAARQRAVLLVSDGVGGLVLTRGGASRGPDPLQVPGNVETAVAVFSWRERFRDYVVKGQTRGAGGNRLDGTASALTAATTPAPTASRPAVRERAGIVMTGRVRDSEVARHRPTVILAKTQSGGASVQTQAEWRMRVARARSETLNYRVLDWRAGRDRKLWRPNELVAVTDPFAGISGDMLVASVAYGYGKDGAVTDIELVGPEAYDLEPIEPRRRGREVRRTGTDGVARPLTAEPTRRGS